MIKELNRLSEDVIREIKELIAECNRHDGLEGMMSLDTAFNFNQEMNTNFLMYHDDKLVSAITMFIPGSQEAEVLAMTLPQYRAKGCFTELLKKAEAELRKYEVPDILFLCEAKSVDGKAAVAKLKTQYEYTEYFLRYNHSLDKKINEYPYRIKLHKAGLEDLESIIKISMSAFNDSYEGAKNLAIAALNADNRQLFLGEIAGEFVAMGVAAADAETTSIHGLGVLTEQQGKGYGKEILYSIINKLIEQKVEDISIEVESENTNAFQLYKNSGFEVESAWEYYRKAVM